MKAQIISDAQGLWTVLFERSPFDYQHDLLFPEEAAEVNTVLRENNLVRDGPEIITRDSIRIRVRPKLEILSHKEE